jgi:redox-sensitive bicupin YhaK (pirin superfamily)
MRVDAPRTTTSPVLEIRPLGFPWQTSDPFLFCVHHVDAYPAGDERMGPVAPLGGRNLGQDFEGKDGWRMYHGLAVPGFPPHPHRGFETVTIVRRGFIDHSDSLGASARFGAGDVQWLTAGEGIVHAEMFPLLDQDGPNPLELFQIWLNLPKADKLAPPHFAMLWRRDIPRLSFADARGKTTEVTLVAGTLDGRSAPPPPPRSWASRADADVIIAPIRMQPGAAWTLPPAADPRALRTLFFFKGVSFAVGGQAVPQRCSVAIRSDVAVDIEAGEAETEILLLQGRPIGETVAQHGPFVMNTREELQRAFADYQRTRFGGWPWPSNEPVHPRDVGRFAKHADGTSERAEG